MSLLLSVVSKDVAVKKPEYLNRQLQNKEFGLGYFLYEYNPKTGLGKEFMLCQHVEVAPEALAALIAENLESGEVRLILADEEDVYFSFGYVITPDGYVETTSVQVPDSIKREVEGIVQKFEALVIADLKSNIHKING
ncbi:MAG: hypothetical protein ACYCSQ_00290 [bacterium]